MELLDFLFTKFGCEQELKHFSLMPFYFGEENIYNIRKKYYEKMGIKLIPYAIDEIGYKQLFDVLKSWNSEIKTENTLQYEILELIETTIDKPDETSMLSIMQIIRNNEKFRNIFFHRLSNCTNPDPWFKKLMGEGYFNPEKSPRPIPTNVEKTLFTIPAWGALQVLENIAKHKTDGIAELIDAIIKHELKLKSEPDYKDNYHTNAIIIRIISYLPYFTELHLKFIKQSFNSVWFTSICYSELINFIFPVLVERKDKKTILEILDLFFSLKDHDFKIDTYYFEKLFAKHYINLKTLFNVQLISFLIKKIKILYKDSYFAFDINHVKSIGNPEERRTQQQVSNILRDLLNDLKPKRIIQALLKNKLNKKRNFFVRQALFFIDKNYDTFELYFWEWLENQNPFNDYFEEFFNLVRNNASKMDDNKKSILIDLLKNANYKNFRNEEEIAFVKKQWLFDLFDELPIQAKSLMEELDRTSSRQPKYRDNEELFFIRRLESPKSKNELLTMPNKEIVSFIKNYKPKQDFDDSDQSALANVLKEAIKEKPEKFLTSIEIFSDINFIYLNKIFEALIDVWQESALPFKNVKFDWKSIFKLTQKILVRINTDANNHYQGWLINKFADLIITGTQKDNHAFEAKFFPVVEEILFAIVNYKSVRDSTPDQEIVRYVINTIQNDIYIALINYSLRYARCQKEGQKHWPESVKQHFTQKLSEKDLVFHFMLGNYMSNLLFLDEKWVEDNIGTIFPHNDVIAWEWAFTGYCYSRSPLTWAIYDLLYNDYVKALNFNFKEQEFANKIIEHILIDYLWKSRKVKDTPLLLELFKIAKLEHINCIIHNYNGSRFLDSLFT